MMEAKSRWLVLSTALVCTLVAIAFPVEKGEEVVEVSIPVPQGRLNEPKVQDSTDRAEIAWVASEEDPFAIRVWQAPPTQVKETTKAVPISAPASAAPPPPPPLPFKFVGQMNNGVERTVYLARGDQVVLANQGDVLDASYKVVAIRPTSIEFEGISSGLKQTLAIPAQEN